MNPRRYRWLTEGETYRFQMNARTTGVPERRGQHCRLLVIGTGGNFPGGRNVLIQFPDGLTMVTVPGVLKKVTA